MKNEWTKIAGKVQKIQGTKNEVLNPTLLTLIETYAEGKNIFDYGCGWGEFADILQKEGFSVVAFDDADEMVEQAKDKFATPTFLYKKEFEEKLLDMIGIFDVVTSNLVLCILEKEQQEILLNNLKSLVKSDGVIIISFCHPKYDYVPDSLISKRFTPPNAQYFEEFIYEKEIKENGIRFHDYHRPLEYYNELFSRHGLKVLKIRESDILGTTHQPDFIVFVLKKV